MPPKKKDDKKDKTDHKEEENTVPPAEEYIDFLLEYREEMDKWDCVQELISEMLDTAYEHGNEGYIQSLVPTFTIDRLVNDALAVVDLAFLPREDRHNEAAEKGDIGDEWRIDQEPEPAPIDRWARGAVPVRSRTAILPGYPQDERLARPGSQPRSSRESLRPRRTSTASEPEPPPKKMPTTFTFSKPAAMQKAQTLSTAEAERDARLRAELEARRALEELQRQQVLADEEEVRKLQHFQKDLRGQDYSYDHKGKLLVLNKMDPEKLPQYIIGPVVKLQKTPEELEAEALLDPKNKKKLEAEKKDKTKKKKKPTKTAPIEYLREETSAQPSLMESMVVKMGVTLKENGGTKPGPGVEVDPERMSRKDFLTILASQKETPKERTPKGTPPGASAPITSTSNAKLLDTSTPDLDWTMDAKVVLPVPPAMKVIPTRSDVNASFEAKITQDKSWGRPPPTGEPFVPPRPPGKVPEKVLQSTFGQLVQTPRDRPFVTATGLKKSVVFGPNSPKKASHSTMKDTRNGPLSPKKENLGELASQKG
mmetsp:Transcript_705/g.1249  ORF Transcript_705/g.1249 Transcript_705/m.1249 type:complete len:538 (-) Transcript_705:98-1711(-)|eukprot:CAMPEP_0198208022 /NCGR_PEP_ID=MMETSP1445-20131203/11421_1 /TAXON_ID=36898 /ORGANISM="Pyramimonas sp., Strain CCMP2087" /LENGTH=537 /DNA_ID=CAMNT_0043881259 /DNA_START=291 /DNA_END=1904 /DNA_ORIENTATION=+